MAGSKEIRTKIKSVQNTRKITKAMEMVSVSKMRKAQERMRHARPYADKVRQIAGNLARANPEYRHPYLTRNPDAQNKIGLILVTTDKGLCGGLNTNLLRIATNHLREQEKSGAKAIISGIGNKGISFMNRIGAQIVSQISQLGDTPHLEKLIGPVKVQLDAYEKGEVKAVYLAYTRFINTMKQEPVVEQLLPLPESHLEDTKSSASWDYVYEPDAQTVLDELLVRYIEALVYQAVAENMASEKSARMVAMKAA